MKNFWLQLNRPLVVLLLGLAVWPLVNAWEQRLAVHSTADAIFQELNRAEDQMNSQAKKSGVEKLVESFVSQFVDGFTSAMDKAGEGKASKLTHYTGTLNQLSCTEVKTVPGNFSSREKIIGLLHNNSPSPVSDVHLNLTLFAADGHLLDVLDKNLGDLKVLQPGQSVGFSEDHDLSVPNQNDDTDDSDASGNAGDPVKKKAAAARKAAQEALRAAKVTAQITSFEVEEPKQP